MREGRSALGSAAPCELRIDGAHVEPLHAFLFVLPGRTSWLDVSLQGSDLNGHRVHGEQVTLEHGARLRVGEASLIYLHVPDGIFRDRE